MSTISATSQATHTSPKQRLLDTISNKASTGSITGTDKTALESAVDDIDSSLNGPDTGGSPTTPSLDPSQMKSRIDSLIDKEVENGTLTSDQAETLKSVFASGGGRGGEGGQGRVGGPGGGPPAGPPPTGGAEDASASDTSSSSSSSDGSSTTASSSMGMDASDILASFMQQLQSSMSQSSGYSSTGTGGSTGGSKLTSALLLNFEA